MGNHNKEVTIVGMGFCGLMTAVHLIRNAENPFKLNIIQKNFGSNKGPAYSTDNPSLVLNVPTAKMSCYPKEPGHFLDWVSEKSKYRNIPKDLLAISFMPRKLYGEYLSEVWEETLGSSKGKIEVVMIDDIATGIRESGNGYEIMTEGSGTVTTDVLVLATGNDTPGEPGIPNMDFYKSPEYFCNPWDIDCVRDLDNVSNVLIIGNGLTMVDTVIGLTDNGFHGKIYSISPNGLAMLQHRHGGVAYKGLIDELNEPYDLDKLFSLFKKHVRLLREIGISAEPVVDSVRGISQKIWMSLSVEEKIRFMKHLRHLWGVARHRVPINVYDRIIRLKLEDRLKVIKGRLLNIVNTENGIKVDFRNTRTYCDESILVSRVINCTGPQTDIGKSKNPFIRSLYESGFIRPDPLKLGIDADTEFRVLGKDGVPNDRILTLGGNLKGLFWESTAVPELRVQAENLADSLLRELVRETEPVME